MYFIGEGVGVVFGGFGVLSSTCPVRFNLMVMIACFTVQAGLKLTHVRGDKPWLSYSVTDFSPNIQPSNLDGAS